MRKPPDPSRPNDTPAASERQRRKRQRGPGPTQLAGISLAGATVPPAVPTIGYVSRATLASLLDCSESTVDEWVRRGIIPRPIRLPTGAVRWYWPSVLAALNSLGTEPGISESDPFLVGIKNVTQTSRRPNGGTS